MTPTGSSPLPASLALLSAWRGVSSGQMRACGQGGCGMKDCAARSGLRKQLQASWTSPASQAPKRNSRATCETQIQHLERELLGSWEYGTCVFKDTFPRSPPSLWAAVCYRDSSLWTPECLAHYGAPLKTQVVKQPMPGSGLRRDGSVPPL